MSRDGERLPETGADHRKGPRRRGEELENAILAAALDELAESGYAGLTMERVAARARTGKAALYRRWPSRADLVVEACRIRGIAEFTPPDTGTLRGDVLALLRGMAVKMEGAFGDILRGLLAEVARDPELARLVRERFHTSGPSAVRGVLEQAAARGEIAPEHVTSRRAAVATDLLRNHFLLFGAPIGDDVIEDIVDDVYLPLLLRPAPPRVRPSED